MKKKLYYELYNLITDDIDDAEERQNDALDIMADNIGRRENDLFQENAKVAADCQRKKRRLREMHRQFENDVVCED